MPRSRAPSSWGWGLRRGRIGARWRSSTWTCAKSRPPRRKSRSSAPRSARTRDCSGSAIPTRERGLSEHYTPDDADGLERGKLQLFTTRGLLEQYNFVEAKKQATIGINELRDGVSPLAAARPYADLVFEIGVAYLGLNKADDAAKEFVLAKRLAPDLQLADDLLPEIVTAYEHATPPKGDGTIDVRGSGRIWIDGAEVGDAPGAFTAQAGPHLVQLAGPDRYPRGQRVDVEANKSVTAEIPDQLASREHRLYRARVAIVTAADSLVRAEAIKSLAHMIGVHDIVFLDVTDDGARVTEQTWQDKEGFSAVHAPEDPAVLLDVLAPPPPTPIEPPTIKVPSGPAEPPLYQRRNFQLGVGAAVIAAIATAIYFGTREGTFSPGHGTFHFKP